MHDNNRSCFIKILEIVLFVLSATIVVLILVQIFSRYVTRLPFQGIEELARLIFVWACCLGVALCVVKGKTIKAEVLRNKLPTKINNWMSLLIDAIIIIVSTVMIITGSQFVVSRWIYPDYSTALLYPRSLFWVPIPISGAIIFIHTTKLVILKVKEIVSIAK